MDKMLKRELLHILHHSLGLNEYGQGKQYRNHFVAGGEDVLKCRELVSLGHMQERKDNGLTGGSPWFSVTRQGINAVSQESPKPPKVSRSKQRYQRFLEYGECFDSFIDYLRWDAEPDRSWNHK